MQGDKKVIEFLNEEHKDWLETQLERIERVGMENYLQSMMKVESS